MASTDRNIILYHYDYSPYARRVRWYLTLRGIPFAQCMQPPVMPRPDLTLLGISHRRIPILSIGRDVYFDSRLMLAKLEALPVSSSSHPKLGTPTAEGQALEQLFDSWTIDAGLFGRATQLIPTNLPLLNDPAYFKDRSDYAGVEMSIESMDRHRPACEAYFQRAMALLEETLLADGRDWILATAEPSLADIQAVWPFHWLTGMPGALPAERFSKESFPKVYAWIARFQKAVSAARTKHGKPATIKGEEAAKAILEAEFNERDGKDEVDANDSVVVAQGLKKGDSVVVWPADFGTAHKDRGRLVKMDMDEVVIEVTAKDEKGTVRVHVPRHGFHVTKDDPARL